VTVLLSVSSERRLFETVQVEPTDVVGYQQYYRNGTDSNDTRS
jgi:hypothetical protein